jgi:ZU5 domain
MSRVGFFRSLAVVAGAIIIASCSEAGISGPNTSQERIAATASVQPAADRLLDHVSDVSRLELKAVWWRKQHKDVIKVSKTIDQSGGTISIPETGLTLSFPAGAVAAPITITVTSDEKYVAYKMEPTGTKFLKDVTATQQLNTTSIFGSPLRSQLYAAYIPDDNVKLSGKVPVLEIEPGTTIFSVLSSLLPQAHVWTIRHFSRYMLASG